MIDSDRFRRIALGDPGAFAAMADEHRPPLLAYARHLTRSRDDAEDLVQDAFVRARAAADRFDGRATERAWLLTIVTREFLRRRRRRPWLPLLDRFALPSHERAVTDGEWLLGLLARLPEEGRIAFLLHEVQGLSMAEIATATEVPEGTVKSRLHAARRRLRELAEPPGESHAIRNEA